MSNVLDPIKNASKVIQRDVHFPEDKLKAGMKERIVATVVTSHELCESGTCFFYLHHRKKSHRSFCFRCEKKK